MDKITPENKFNKHVSIKIAMMLMIKRFNELGSTLMVFKFYKNSIIDADKSIQNIIEKNKSLGIMQFFHYVPHTETKDNWNIIFFAFNLKKENWKGGEHYTVEDSKLFKEDCRDFIISSLIRKEGVDKLNENAIIYVGYEYAISEYVNVIYYNTKLNIDISSHKFFWSDSFIADVFLKEFLEALHENNLDFIPSHWGLKITKISIKPK